MAQTTGGGISSKPLKPPKPKPLTSIAQQVAGQEVRTEMGGTAKGEGTTATHGKGGGESGSATYADTTKDLSKPKPRPEGGGGGGRESGGQAGVMEMGADGQFSLPKKMTRTVSGFQTPDRYGRASGFRNQVITSAGARDAGSPHGVYEVGGEAAGTAAAAVGGGGGGGGTGNPLAALGSAIKTLNLKGAEFGGKSVEEVTAFGAKKTRRTGARRSQ